jgi:hypothetical protein
MWNFSKFLKIDITKFTKALLFNTNKFCFWWTFIQYKIYYILFSGMILFPILCLGVPTRLNTPIYIRVYIFLFRIDQNKFRHWLSNGELAASSSCETSTDGLNRNAHIGSRCGHYQYHVSCHTTLESTTDKQVSYEATL